MREVSPAAVEVAARKRKIEAVFSSSPEPSPIWSGGAHEVSATPISPLLISPATSRQVGRSSESNQLAICGTRTAPKSTHNALATDYFESPSPICRDVLRDTATPVNTQMRSGVKLPSPSSFSAVSSPALCRHRSKTPSTVIADLQETLMLPSPPAKRVLLGSQIFTSPTKVAAPGAAAHTHITIPSSGSSPVSHRRPRRKKRSNTSPADTEAEAVTPKQNTASSSGSSPVFRHKFRPEPPSRTSWEESEVEAATSKQRLRSSARRHVEAPRYRYSERKAKEAAREGLKQHVGMLNTWTKQMTQEEAYWPDSTHGRARDWQPGAAESSDSGMD